MKKAGLLLALLTFFVVGLSGFGMFQTKDKDKGKMEGGHMMKVMLSGSAEVPGPGDPDGSGDTSLTINEKQGQLCFEVNVKDIGKPTAAHIHKAATGQSGRPLSPSQKIMVPGMVVRQLMLP
jgi:CHRD domain